MSTKTETKEINGREYSVTQWPAEKALLMKFKLTKIIGAPLALLIASQDESNAEADIIAKSIAALFDKSTPEDLLAVIKECVIGVACNTQKITNSSFSSLFIGDNLMDVYQVLFFVVRVNFGGLFKGQLVENLLAQVPKSA